MGKPDTVIFPMLQAAFSVGGNSESEHQSGSCNSHTERVPYLLTACYRKNTELSPSKGTSTFTPVRAFSAVRWHL